METEDIKFGNMGKTVLIVLFIIGLLSVLFGNLWFFIIGIITIILVVITWFSIVKKEREDKKEE